MYQVARTEPLVSVYRHTSHLRGFDLPDDDSRILRDSDYPSFYPNTVVDKPRTFVTAASSLYDTPRFSQTPSPDESETDTVNATTTASMAAASATEVSSIHGGDDVDTTARNGAADPSSGRPTPKKRAPLAPSSDMGDFERSPRRGGYEWEIRRTLKTEVEPEGHDGHIAPHSRHEASRPPSYERDDEHARGLHRTSSRQADGDRLPGIAHLDRQMHTPWSVNGLTPARRGIDDLPPRWGVSSPSSSLRRPVSEEESHIGEPSPHRQVQSSRYTDGREENRAPICSPYKRPASPFDREREYEQHRHRLRTASHAQSGQNAYNGENQEVAGAWPLSPASRQRSPLDREGGREWPSGRYEGSLPPAALPPLLRASHPHDDRPALPFVPSRGPRHDVRRSSPLPLRNSFDSHRTFGGSAGISNSNSNSNSEYGQNQHAHPGYRPIASLPRTSATSLRSLSMPFPYEAKAHVAHTHDHHPVDGGYYDEVDVLRHDRPASLHSSPRHYPHASLAGSGGALMHGGAAADAVGGSPPHIGRRRGKLPKPVTDLLKSWLLDHAAHPYPTEDEKRRLCTATGLSVSQVSNWFINARRRILIPNGSGHFGVNPSVTAAQSSSSTTDSASVTRHPSPGPAVRAAAHHPGGHASLPSSMHERHHTGMPLAPPPPHHFAPHHSRHAAHYPPPPTRGEHAFGYHETYPRSAEHSPRTTRTHN